MLSEAVVAMVTVHGKLPCHLYLWVWSNRAAMKF